MYYTYDSANNVTQKEDQRGYYWYSTYDGMGNVLTATPPGGTKSTLTYNAHNRMLTAQLPSGRSVAVTYDANDNPTRVQGKDASGNVTATTSLTIGTYGLVSDKYDANNHHTAYAYDTNGNLTSMTTPLGHQTQWAYDTLGFQTSRKDAMLRTTTYTPDAWERNITTSYPDGTTNSYGYDANSNLKTFNNYTANWTRTYDADNRMLTEAIPGTTTVSHSYDASGQKGLLSTTTDTDGRVLTYAYSARNELASVGEAAGTESYAYDASGNQLHRYLPNGLRTDQYYNGDGTLYSYYNWNGQSTILQSYGYAYNADHQMTSYNEGTSADVVGSPNPNKVAYGYDALGHLTSDVRTGNYAYSKSYTVDGANNRLNMTENGAVNTLSHDGDDELNSVSGTGAVGFTYNANGDQITSTINGAQTTYAYDFDDQLTSITKSGNTTTYRYDALGRQVSRQVGSVFTGYYLDGSQILEEKGTNGTTQYTWGNGLIRRGSEYPMTDGQGTTKLVTSSSQAITSTQETEAFGRTLATTGSTSSPFGYHGAEGYRQDGDGPAGLEPYQKVGARYYDATYGRFITRDTDLSQDPYAYCSGDPVNSDDPSGHIHIPTMVPQPNDGPGGPSSDGSGDGDGLGGPSGTDPGGSSPGGGTGGSAGGGGAGSASGAGGAGSASPAGPVSFPVGSNGGTVTIQSTPNGTAITAGTTAIKGVAVLGNDNNITSIGGILHFGGSSGPFATFSGSVATGSGKANGQAIFGWQWLL